MTQEITVQPSEQGTAKVTVTLTDESGDALVFGDLTDPQWQLMRSDGTVINGRTFAASSLTSLTWVLTGDDLAVFGGLDSGRRVLSFTAKYDSSLANDLTVNGEARFAIDQLLGQVDIT